MFSISHYWVSSMSTFITISSVLHESIIYSEREPTSHLFSSNLNQHFSEKNNRENLDVSLRNSNSQDLFAVNSRILY